MLKSGNTVSNTIYIEIKNSVDSGKFEGKSQILLSGFVFGYSWV